MKSTSDNTFLVSCVANGYVEGDPQILKEEKRRETYHHVYLALYHMYAALLKW